jgi:hypothetical protein
VRRRTLLETARERVIQASRLFGVDVLFVVFGIVVGASFDKPWHKSILDFGLQFYAKLIFLNDPVLLLSLALVGPLSSVIVSNSWLSDVNERRELSWFVSAT